MAIFYIDRIINGMVTSDTEDSRWDVPEVGLWYPRLDGNAKHLQIGLSDVRAADNIRVSYDFERDGWVIEQAAVFEWDCDDEKCDAEWAEVAFVQAWGRQRVPDPSESDGGG